MFNFFKKKKKIPRNFKEVLQHYQKLEKDLKELTQELANFKKESNFFIQKVGIVRFNPFGEIGGDQSFSIALLDSKDNGLVLTSLYNRGGNRVYAKPIKQGNSSYHLSEEEKKAVEQAKDIKARNSKFTIKDSS